MFELLFVFTCISSIVLTSAGVAGGVILFGFLSISYGIQAAIGIHGFSQMLVNGTKLLFFWKFIHWKIVFLFMLPVILGCYTGSVLINIVNPIILLFIVSIFICQTSVRNLFTKKPETNIDELVDDRHSNKSSITKTICVYLVATTSMIIGVSGPLMIPILQKSGCKKESLIATKAICQFILQISKITFLVTIVKFSYSSYLTEIIIIIAATIFGVYLGKIILNKINDKIFNYIINSLLLMIGIYLFFKSINLAIN